MSALGQKQTSAQVRVMSALPPKADIGSRVMSALCQKQTAAAPFNHHANLLSRDVVGADHVAPKLDLALEQCACGLGRFLLWSDQAASLEPSENSAGPTCVWVALMVSKRAVAQSLKTIASRLTPFPIARLP